MNKPECVLCQIVEGKIPSKKIYEDKDVIVVLDVNGANPGHSFVIPKNHYPILEQIPDHLVGKLFQVANKVSIAIFDGLQVQGTNIFVSNGVTAGQRVAHFMIQVIPRIENDGINLQWARKQLGEEEMSTIELKLKEFTKDIGDFQTEEKKKPRLKKAKKKSITGEDSYIIKQLRRLP